jgi:dipeptidyl aminopeptidase/acylaminoacyl peptidase
MSRVSSSDHCWPSTTVPLAEVARRLILALLLLAIGAGRPAVSRAQVLDFDAATDEVALSDPQISPDGEGVLIVARRRNFVDNRMENQLYLVDVASGERRALTHGRHRVANARWSPDGERIAFQALDEDEKAAIFVLPAMGGEAQQVTEQEEGVESFEWSPDGARFAFVGAEKVPDKEGEEKHNLSFEVGGDWYLADKVSPARHLWVVASEGGEPEKLTNEHTLAYLGGGFAWQPDGEAIVFSAQPDPYTASFLRGSLRRVTLEGEETALAAEPASYGGALPSPDGRWVAYQQTRGTEVSFSPSAVKAVSAQGGDRRDLTEGLDRSIEWARWLPDSQSLLVAGPDETSRSLWHQPLDGEARRIDLGDIVFGAGSLSSGGRLAFTGLRPRHPAELFVLDDLDGSARVLTDFNARIAERDLGRVEKVVWRNDGFEEDGVLIYPPGFEAGQQYPLVLMIHGGPMGTSTTAFSLTGQLAAARGWLVFLPNYRGSTNRGEAYQHAVVGDAGAGPGRDVMAGIEAVKAKGIVDESRIGVTGWSYGGYMTVWLTSHYDIWRAAVSGAAVTDWFDWYALSDINVWSGYGLGGSPWTKGNDAHYREQSPITYAKNIRTPTLILSTTLDPRVSVTQSFKLYSLLRDHGVPVKFVAYPVPGHFPRDPVHWRDIYRRWFDWLEQHFEEEQ